VHLARSSRRPSLERGGGRFAPRVWELAPDRLPPAPWRARILGIEGRFAIRALEASRPRHRLAWRSGRGLNLRSACGVSSLSSLCSNRLPLVFTKGDGTAGPALVHLVALESSSFARAGSSSLRFCGFGSSLRIDSRRIVAQLATLGTTLFGPRGDEGMSRNPTGRVPTGLPGCDPVPTTERHVRMGLGLCPNPRANRAIRGLDRRETLNRWSGGARHVRCPRPPAHRGHTGRTSGPGLSDVVHGTRGESPRVPANAHPSVK
jgi:hypothetical protein